MLVAAHKSPEAFRTISEVAAELDVPQHVLRFWETKFATVRPLKRGGGRRYYRPDDVDLLRGIRSLLYSDGLTIKGVQKILREQGPRYVMDVGRGTAGFLASTRVRVAAPAQPGPKAVARSNVHPFPRETERAEGAMDGARRMRLNALLTDLLTLKARLKAARPRISS
jgi:DNA-binding transcriptional MerR regulator